MRLSPASAFFQWTKRIRARGRGFAFLCLHVPLIVLSFGCCGYASQAAAEPFIFHASLSAQPGDAISLQGTFSESAKVLMKLGAVGDPISLPAETQSEGHAIVQIPSSLAYGFYQVWVEDNGVDSPVVNINQAWGQHFVTPDIAPRSSFRLFGRNLHVAGATPQAWLVNHDTNSTSSLAVDVAASDPYVLSLTAPDDVQKGATYDVYVSNGLAGPYDATKVDKQLTGIAAGQDYFGLGVAWAQDLNFYGNVYDVTADKRLPANALAKGGGVTSDFYAIQNAIYWVSSHGCGIVRLPAGTYNIDAPANEINPALGMAKCVVLQGAGKNLTTLTYGHNVTPYNVAGGRDIINWDPNYDNHRSGLADLALVNVDTTGKVKSGVSGTNQSEVFIQRCIFNMGQANGSVLQYIDKLSITNSEFNQSGEEFNYSSHYRITSNTFRYGFGGIDLSHTTEGVFEGNQELRDGTARYNGTLVIHQLTAGFAENIAIINNLFQVLNGPAQDQGGGETILSEYSTSDRVDDDSSMVRAATANSLTLDGSRGFTLDPTTGWNKSSLWHPVVAIVNGPGMGQVRDIATLSGSTLTINNAWDVLPTTDSRYAIFNWGARNWLVRGNTLQDNRVGIAFAHTTDQVAIVGNRLTNNGFIAIFPDQQAHDANSQAQYKNSYQEFLPAYDNQIIGNTVDDLNGGRTQPAIIGITSLRLTSNTLVSTPALLLPPERVLGTLAIGLEVRSNSLTAHIPNLTNADANDNRPEGYNNWLFVNGSYVDEHVPGILGSIFQNNTAINTDSAITLTTGSYDTFVCNTKLINSPNLIDDVVIGGAGHASVGTAQCSP